MEFKPSRCLQLCSFIISLGLMGLSTQVQANETVAACKKQCYQTDCAHYSWTEKGACLDKCVADCRLAIEGKQALENNPAASAVTPVRKSVIPSLDNPKTIKSEKNFKP